MSSDTIFAPLTIKGKCSLFVIRISGTRVTECLKILGVDKDIRTREATHCNIYYENRVLDSAIIIYFKSPNSFTGEDVVELDLHCSSYIINKVYEILLNVDGVRLATNGEFSKRAFLNGKMDLVEAEAICDLISSETGLQHNQAIKQLLGQSSEFFDGLKDEILEISSGIEALIDFPEDGIEDISISFLEEKIILLKEKITNALDENRVGEKIKNGLNVAIIGASNVGKSSFLNFLAGRDAAIVCDIAGTTRDIIEIKTEINGLIINVSDTAGIRNSDDFIENEGIKRSIKTAKDADFKILILDVQHINIEERIKNLVDNNTLVLLNKIDLLDESEVKKIRKNLNFENDIIEISIKNAINLDRVIEYLGEYVEKNVTSHADRALSQERHRIELKKTITYLKEIDFKQPLEIVAEKIRLATFALGQITGQINTEEILDRIFSKFCVGK
ncbi:MAG: tRNA uridine-5-carboxymethylaminomethyl(34) synthesis GTPase MnmE [Rickettsiales bacterium]|nr:tRNA uridine-5-carboxymethylaminomethyl(34) synthesis GTPase MnmE [Rickettsiales bacterium]